MIVTITLNPSIDTVYFMDELKINDINRVAAPLKAAGGKGINAARAAALMGAEVTAIGLIAGESGDWLERHLQAEGILTPKMTKISGETRTSYTIMHDKGQQTEIIEEGPLIGKPDIVKMLEVLQPVKDEISVICISGSANSKDDNIYVALLQEIKKQLSVEIPIFLDTSGAKFTQVLKSETLPDFIKPNEEEFSFLVGKEIKTKAEALAELKKSELFAKLPNVMISFGGQGAVCKMDNKYYDVTVPKISIVNTTGSGDSTFAGMAYGFEKNLSTVDKIKTAMACGMSNAQQKEIGKVVPADVEKFMDEIEVVEA